MSYNGKFKKTIHFSLNIFLQNDLPAIELTQTNTDEDQQDTTPTASNQQQQVINQEQQFVYRMDSFVWLRK
jgi:hypothetical protein